MGIGVQEKGVKDAYRKDEFMEEQGSIATPTLEKRCTGPCGQMFPATEEFFYSYLRPSRRRVEMTAKCKKCHNATKKKKKVLQSSQDVASMANGHAQGVEKPVARKSVAGTPDRCGSCGTEKGNILGDIDKKTHKKYGYLCAKCHQLVRDFHGDITRMRKVLAYIEMTRPSHV